MALQLAATKFGTDFPSAYHRVTYQSTDVAGTEEIRVWTYANAEARKNAPDEPLAKASYTITGDKFTTLFADSALRASKTSPVSQAYGYLKTLAAFKDAKDV